MSVLAQIYYKEADKFQGCNNPSVPPGGALGNVMKYLLAMSVNQ